MKIALYILVAATTAFGITVTNMFVGGPAAQAAPQFKSFWIVGDSKSTYDFLQSQIIGEFNTRFTNHILFSSSPARDAAAGRSVRVYALGISNTLAALSGSTSPDYVLFNLGVNDMTGDVNDVGDGVTWKTNLAFIFDSIHTKWTNSQIYQMRVWRQGTNYTSKIALIDDTLIPQVHTNRSWCHLGPDERVFLEHGDDGATMTLDGLHPNTTGQAATATAWKNSLFP